VAFWKRQPAALSIVEAAPPAVGPQGRMGQGFQRKGYDADIPAGGSTDQHQSIASSLNRQQELDELYQIYMSCPPVSTAVDAIARTITAGGLEVVPDVDDQEELHATPTDAPAGVKQLQDLLDYVNPYDDIRQLTRNIIVDLLVAGDSFIEITWKLGRPFALWHLDAASMIPIADEHGIVSKYKQVCGPNRYVVFEPHEIIHIKLDAPRGGVFGVSPVKKLRAPILAYIWTSAVLKETMRKGNPPRLHASFSQAEDEKQIRVWREKYPSHHLGPLNIGVPITTKGAALQEFKASAIAELLETLDTHRDIILSGMGVPGRKVGVSEPGSLGGQGAELGQAKTYHFDTCEPVAQLVLEKLNFTLLNAFEITGWRQQFGKIDYRDEFQAEQIRDMRVKNGTWAINRARADAGEPPAEGGDIPIFAAQRYLIAIPDMPEFSKANLAEAQAKGQPQSTVPQEPDLPTGPDEPDEPDDSQTTPPAPPKGQKPAKATETWDAGFKARRRRLLSELQTERQAA
jgi:hypothetical protein